MRQLLCIPWTDDQLKELRRLLDERMPVRKIAHRMRRTQSSVRGKMVQEGWHAPTSPEQEQRP